MENNLVSVAMATYNGEKFLRQQLESIYKQTHNNIEVIVNDDCSSDTTVDILHEFHLKYGLNYKVNIKNQGFVQNFQNALARCSGNFIALADQDDIWLPQKLEILLKEIKDYSMICSDAILINEQGQQINESLKSYQKIFIPEKEILKYLVYNNFVTGCTCCFKKELLSTAIPIPVGFGYHDWWLALAATKANGIKYLPAPLVKYRQHSSNDTGAIPYLSFILKLAKRFKNNHPVHHKKKYYTMKVNSLSLLLDSTLPLNGDEKDFIKDSIALYSDKLNTAIHVKALTVAYKHQHYIFPNSKFIDKQLLIAAWLFN